MSELTLALWALNLDQRLGGAGAWLEQVDRRMVEAARGADLLVLPEYTSAVWLNWALADVTAVREVAWMAEQAESILPAYPELVQRHGVALLAGSGPAGETVEGPGPLTFARLPLGEIRRLRAGVAEVWPGAWFADHVRTEGG